MINYIGKFISNLSNNTYILRNLLHKDSLWNWTKDHENAFNHLKQQLLDVNKLAYFNPMHETHLHVDAGPFGLGAILSQHNGNQTNIIAYASKSLTQTEQRYSQIEKETLAATWAIQYFHTYLFGDKFVLHTDHKPLVNILQNPKSSPSARIERLCLRIQQYQFQTVHEPGSQNPSDYLSRYPQSIQTAKQDKIEQYVNFITRNSTPKLLSLEEIQSETNNDNCLKLLKDALITGNENLWKNILLKPFKQIQNELSANETCILRGNRIIIPTSLQEKVIALAHRGHQGIVKTKQLLRTKVWFPGIDSKTENAIKHCLPCQAVTPKIRNRNPIATIDLPTTPFSKIDIDYAGPFPNGKYILLLIDEFSRFPIAKIVPSTNSTHLITFLEETFSLFGIPTTLKSDNGPPFNGHELKNFLDNLNIKHHRITPYWPEANGIVERFVKTIKKSLLCTQIETNHFDSQLQQFLMNYRSTPHQNTEKTPFELVFNRSIRNFLPNLPENNATTDQTKDKGNRQKNNDHADRQRKTLSHKFKIGDKVLCKQRKTNSLIPFYDPLPYTITAINESQITAKRNNTQITRNCSFLKYFHSLPNTSNNHPNNNSQQPIQRPQKDNTFIDFQEAEEAEEEEEEVQEEPARQETSPRPQRIRNQPTHLQDYLIY